MCTRQSTYTCSTNCLTLHVHGNGVSVSAVPDVLGMLDVLGKSVLSWQDYIHTSSAVHCCKQCCQIGQLTRCVANSREGCAHAGGTPSMHSCAFLLFVFEALCLRRCM
jgi:hypothetical protein